jgi:hypothetical protein
MIGFFLIVVGIAGILPAAEKKAGELYLENTRQVYRLTGQWRFSRKDQPQFALPDYDDSDWEWIAVPGQWNRLGIEDATVAWYRFRFRLSPAFRVVPVAIRVPAIADVHELYVNGKLVGGAGTLGSDGTLIKKNSQPGVYLIPNNLLGKESWNVIALRVGDDIGWGGIVTSDFFIGRAEIVELEFKKFIVWNSAVFIILAFLGLYFLVLYLVFSREKSYLYFSQIAMIVSLMLFGYFSFPYWVIDNYWFNHYIFHSGIHIALIFAFYFVYAFYGYPADRITKVVTLCFSLLFGVFLLTPFHHAIIRFYCHVTLTVTLVLDAIGFIYLLLLGVRSIRLRKEGAKLLGAGGLIVFLCFLNDILGYLLIFDNRRFGLEGMVVFMVVISFAMFLKYSKITNETSPLPNTGVAS